MFTGLVEARARVRKTQPRGRGLRLWVAAPKGWSTARGRSISVSGVCLTAAAERGQDLVFDLSAETIARTWLSRLRSGASVNLERAMKLSDRLDGHLVTGHVDGRGKIVRIDDSRDGGRVFTFEVEKGLEKFLVDKGSVAVDGVSLTVVAPRRRKFKVAVIPETLKKTTLGLAQAGDPVNIESDLIAKWLAHLSHRAPR